MYSSIYPLAGGVAGSSRCGEGECNLGMDMFVYAQVEVVLPHFRPPVPTLFVGAVLRGIQMGEARWGQYATLKKK